LEKIETDSYIFEEKRVRSSDFVYGVAGGMRVLDARNFDIDVHGYSRKLFDEEHDFGGSFQSDVLNITTEGNDYFAAIKFFGEGGDFEGNFRERTRRYGSFVGEYGAPNLWQDKKGIYGFTERKNGEKKTGAAVCFDDSCFIGGRVEKADKRGYFVGVERGGFRIDGSYSDNRRSEKCDLEMEFSLTKDLSVGAYGSLSGGNTEGGAMFSFSF
jgi:hypothetical protein